MAENLMNSEHKATKPIYRDNYEKIFVDRDDSFDSLAEAIKHCDGTGKTVYVIQKRENDEKN